ncbi:hypothetical protein HOY80DRAFT_880572 [Tuber brumale]|nr:hypothetical protein HOY80DRAFT_880572 [Tuber brumale]
MGNICSRDKSIRKTKVGTGELRNDTTRPVRDRGEAEVKGGVRGATARCGGGSGSRTSDRMTTAPTSRMVRHDFGLRGSRDPRFLKELEARRRKMRYVLRDRS